MIRDPNKLTGLSEAELAARTTKREIKWVRESSWKRMRDAPHLFFPLLISIVVCLGAFALGKSDWVPRLAAMWVAFAVLIEAHIVSQIRIEGRENLVKILMFQVETTSQVEASRAIKLAFPDAFVRSLSGGDTVSVLSDQLAAYEGPFTRVSTWLAVLGTFFWAFGDWITCLIFNSECATC